MEALTTGEAAALLRVTPSRVRQLVLAGQLPAKRFGRALRLRYIDVERLRRKRSKRWKEP